MVRCEINDVVLITGRRVGVVRYRGSVKNSVGIYVGVEIFMTDSEYGNCDGSLEGVRYFQCPKDHGMFISELQVKRKIVAEELLEKLVSLNNKNQFLSAENQRINSTLDSYLRRTVELEHTLQELHEAHTELQSEVEFLKERLMARETSLFAYSGESNPAASNPPPNPRPDDGEEKQSQPGGGSIIDALEAQPAAQKNKFRDGFDMISENNLKDLHEYLSAYPHKLNNHDPIKASLAIWCVRKNNIEALQVLHTCASDMDQGDVMGWTPLFYATIWDRPAMVKLLLKWGCDIEAIDRGCWTPALYAALSGNNTMLRLLAQYGSNLSRYVYDGKTPLTIAAERGYDTCLEVISDFGIDISPAFRIVKQSQHESMSENKRQKCMQVLDTLGV